MHAEICPICKGTGTCPCHPECISKCHGCDGDGWIEVSNDPIGYRPEPYDCDTVDVPWYPWPYDTGSMNPDVFHHWFPN